MHRLIVLFSFCMINIANALVWITFAAISSLTRQFYQISTDEVNALSVCYLALYLPGSIAAVYVFLKYSLRVGILNGAGITMIGGWIRYISVHCSTSNAFGVLLFGQILAGFAQPFITNSPAKVSARFFTVKERDLATTVAAMSNAIGIIIGTTVPSAFVSFNTSSLKVVGFDNLLLFEALFCTAAFIIGFLCLDNRPEQLASISQEMIVKTENMEGSFSEICRASFEKIKICLKNRNFFILTLSFALGFGMFNAITTLIEQVTAPFCYTTDDASLFGGLFVGIGLLGAFLSGVLLDRIHKYKLFLRIILTFGLIFTVGLTLSLRLNSLDAIGAMFALLGFFSLPFLPVAFEAAVEVTFPIPEDISSGILMTSGQLTGIAFIYGLSALIKQQSSCAEKILNGYSYTYTNANIMLLIIVASATILIYFFEEENNRLKEDRINVSQ